MLKTIPKALTTTLLGLLCALSLAAASAAPAAQTGRAGEARVVVVNVERLLADSPRARAAAARIEAEFAPRRQKMQAQLRLLRDKSEQLARDASTLSEREHLLRSRELGELERTVRRAQAQIGEDFAERNAEERAALARRIHGILHTLPASLGVDLVLTRTVWHRPAIDVTDKVAAMLER